MTSVTPLDGMFVPPFIPVPISLLPWPMGECVHAISDVCDVSLVVVQSWATMSLSITRLAQLPRRLDTKWQCLMRLTCWPILSPAIHDGLPHNNSCINGCEDTVC